MPSQISANVRFVATMANVMVRALVVIAALCTSACRSIRTTDTLASGTPKGYVEIFSDPMRLCCGVKAKVIQLNGPDEHVIGSAWRWNTGFPFEYHGRRIACTPGNATFFIDLESGGFGVSRFRLRLGPLAVKVCQGAVTPIRVTPITLPPKGPAEVGAYVEEPQPLNWSPVLFYSRFTPGQWKYVGVPNYQFHVISTGVK